MLVLLEKKKSVTCIHATPTSLHLKTVNVKRGMATCVYSVLHISLPSLRYLKRITGINRLKCVDRLKFLIQQNVPQPENISQQTNFNVKIMYRNKRDFSP